MPKHSYYLPSRKLVSQDDAAVIARARVPRSRFTNQWSKLTTFDAGELIPFLIDDILPGDHMRYNITAYVRMATALFPQFSNQRLDTHLFFVPYRILWENWEKFQGAQATPASSIAFTTPQVQSANGGFTPNTLGDHFDFPCIGQVDPAAPISTSAFPWRAYNRIYNDWFRDQNLINSATVHVSDATQTDGAYPVQIRAKSHDYFTSALPWPQKFTPLQTLFTGTAPIIGIGASDGVVTGGAANVRQTDGTLSAWPATLSGNIAGNIFIRAQTPAAAISATNIPQVYADLAQATGVTINALRQAWLVQDLLERDARGGTRYTEIIRSHFGVISPDFRLDRPEYIGGGQTPINITPIAQTATGGGGLGALGGVGTAAGQHSASYAATEHGIILGLISIKTELHYQQGINRMWSRSTRYDYYMPALAGLGEQAILRKEIFATGVTADDNTVFGYQERWHEYRTRYSTVSGMFRSTTASNIDEWHLAEHFSPAPTLSQVFVQDSPPMSRILSAGAAAANMQYLADILINRVAVRPVPMFGTPATLARF